MYATDFEYGGRYLSDFSFIICNFGGVPNIQTVSAGSEITFEKVTRNQGKIFSLANTKYDNCIQTSFQICKNPCMFNDQRISSDEFRELMRWLNRREFLDFKPFDDNQDDREDIHFRASFNINKIILNGSLYGLELIMETDKPFGYGNLCNFKYSFGMTDIGKAKILKDMSDEIGSICPKVVITCKADGNLTLKNINQDCETIIKNCHNGEVVTIDGDTQIISSSLPFSVHDIASDFNYDFFKIGNTYTNRENKITVSLPCDLSISYYPIIKDIP